MYNLTPAIQDTLTQSKRPSSSRFDVEMTYIWPLCSPEDDLNMGKGYTDGAQLTMRIGCTVVYILNFINPYT